MNWVIFPKYAEETTKTTWVVKMLKALGVTQLVGWIAFGWVIGGPYISRALVVCQIMSQDAAQLSGPLIGLAIGIFSGLWASLAAFALAQVIDDIHATRLQTGAYVAFQSDSVKLGR